MKQHLHESSWRDTPEKLNGNLKMKGGPWRRRFRIWKSSCSASMSNFGDEYQPLSVIWGGFKVFKARAKAMYPKMHHPANLLCPKKGEIHGAFYAFKVYQSRIIPGNESTWPSSWQDGAKLTCCLKRWFRKKKKLILSNPPLSRIFSESSHQFPQRHPDRKIWRS